MDEQTRAAQARQNIQRADHLLSVCRQAQDLLYEAQDKLGSARNWGVVDILGGGFFTNLIKHGKIDDATRYLDRASPLLRRLGKELGQLNLPAGEYGIDIGGFAVFADFFFDDIFSGLYVQSKIGELNDNINQTLRELEQVQDALERLKAHEQTELG